VKYRHKILIDEIEKRLRELLYKIAEDNEITIVEYNSGLDHVHLLVDCRPQHYIPDMLKALKGVSARYLMRDFDEELRKKLWSGHLWSSSYFVATVSETTATQIKTYIESQQQKD
jgi:putative transposase